METFFHSEFSFFKFFSSGSNYFDCGNCDDRGATIHLLAQITMVLRRLHTLMEEDLVHICCMTYEAVGMVSLCYAIRINLCRLGVLMKQWILLMLTD